MSTEHNNPDAAASRSWGARWEGAIQMTRYSLRQMRRSPGFTMAVALSFALGIGANATMFGVVDRLLLRPPAHVSDPDRVRRLLAERYVPATGNRETVELLSFADYRDFVGSPAFASVAAVNRQKMTFGRGLEARQRYAGLVTGGFFSLLGTVPELGRFFGPDEDRPGAPGVAVVSHGMWQRELGGDRSVIGKTLDFGAGPYTIIGVAPAGFTGVELEPVEVWLPLQVAATQTMGTFWVANRNLNWLRVVARLRPGIAPAAAEADATRRHRQGRNEQIQQKHYDPTARILAASVIAARGPLASKESRVATWLAAISLLVLLISCANVANLLLARAIRQRQETGIRLALGSSRGQLLHKVLTDSILLALLGGVAAVLLTLWGGRLLRTMLLPQIDWSDAAVGADVFIVIIALALIAGATAGLIPALQASRTDLGEVLRGSSRHSGGPGSRARHALTVLQAALSVVLLVWAGLFVRSLRAVSTLPLGIKLDQLLLVTADFEHGTPEQRGADFLRQAAERLRQLPVVAHASVDVSVPFYSDDAVPLRVPGLDSVPSLPTGGPTMHAVDDDYFETVGLRILRGRAITREDDRPGAALVAVVNETMARVVWPGKDPIGKCLIINDDRAHPGKAPCATVVGVVENSRRTALLEGETTHYYFPETYRIAEKPPIAVLVRVRGSEDAAIAPVQGELLRLDPAVRFVDARPMRELVDPETRSWKLGATVFSAFGGLALIVAGIGLYGVLAFGVAQRRLELGIRAAVGATSGQLVGMVLRESLRLVGIGIVPGLLAVLAAAPRVEPLLFRISPYDPLTVTIVVLAIGAVAILAAALPARSAARAQPSLALRAE